MCKRQEIVAATGTCLILFSKGTQLTEGKTFLVISGADIRLQYSVLPTCLVGCLLALQHIVNITWIWYSIPSQYSAKPLKKLMLHNNHKTTQKALKSLEVQKPSKTHSMWRGKLVKYVQSWRTQSMNRTIGEVTGYLSLLLSLPIFWLCAHKPWLQQHQNPLWVFLWRPHRYFALTTASPVPRKPKGFQEMKNKFVIATYNISATFTDLSKYLPFKLLTKKSALQYILCSICSFCILYIP